MSVELLDSPIAFHRAFVGIGAGITGALMLSQAVYWTKRTKDENGWFYKTRADWEDETGLSRTEQETARAKLKKLGVLVEKKRGVPCKTHYRVDVEKLNELLHRPKKPSAPSLQDSRKQGGGNPANKNAENPPTGLQEPCQQVGGIPANKSAENPPSITEITTETTKDYEQDDCADLAKARPSPPEDSDPVERSGDEPSEALNGDLVDDDSEIVPGWTFARLIDPPEQDSEAGTYIALPLRSDEQPPVHFVTERDVLNLQQMYRGIDVADELRLMLGWTLANPAKRKTKVGIRRSISFWLGRAKTLGGSPYGPNAKHLVGYEKTGHDPKAKRENVRQALRDIHNTDW